MRKRRTRRGFTLIEAIAAVVILAIGLPPMLWAVREAHLARANPVLASRARWLAEARLEQIIADRHSTTRGWTYVTTAAYAAESPVAGFDGFDRSVARAEREADLITPGSGYLVVTVTVDWTDAAGAARSVSVSTVLTEYAP